MRWDVKRSFIGKEQRGNVSLTFFALHIVTRSLFAACAYGLEESCHRDLSSCLLSGFAFLYITILNLFFCLLSVENTSLSPTIGFACFCCSFRFSLSGSSFLYFLWRLMSFIGGLSGWPELLARTGISFALV
jgi:hypothetical protein